MKKLNKKGFTLIELLAVIIILGVLMIIAVPSVTEYISSSRKSAYIDTAYGYIDAVRTKVNSGEELQFYDVNTLYLVPVGNTTNVCVAVEKGGKSPFSDRWDYAYVGVTYTGQNYNYYFVAKDGSNQGINFVSDNTMNKDGGDLVVSGTAALANYQYLADAYGVTSGTQLTPGLKSNTLSTTLSPSMATWDTTDASYKGKAYLAPTFNPAHLGISLNGAGTGYDCTNANSIFEQFGDKAACSLTKEWADPVNADALQPGYELVKDASTAPGTVIDFAGVVQAEEAKDIDFIVVVPADLC